MDRMEQLRALLKDSPKDSFLRHALALELQKTGADPAAISELKSLLADDPGYVGSYYQLGKLLEKSGNETEAIEWYQRGMQYAKSAGEKRAYNELQSALEELTF